MVSVSDNALPVKGPTLFLDLVSAYFRSGRPYQLILLRLRKIHGIKRR